jgi:hypothetical protein
MPWMHGFFFWKKRKRWMRIVFQLNTLNRSIYTLHPRRQRHVSRLVSSHKRTLTYLPTLSSQSLHSRATQSMYVFASKKCIHHSQMPNSRPSLASTKERPSNAQAHIRSLVIHSTAPLLDLSMPDFEKGFQPLRIRKHHDAPYKCLIPTQTQCPVRPPPDYTSLRFVHCANRIFTRNYTSQYNADTDFPNSSPH